MHWYALRVAVARDGLQLGHDPLAAAARLAGGGCMKTTRGLESETIVVDFLEQIKPGVFKKDLFTFGSRAVDCHEEDALPVESA